MTARSTFITVFLLACWGPVPTDGRAQVENYTHKLTQSNVNAEYWTAPPTERVFKDAPIPAATASAIKLYAARNEFEPFQVVIKPAFSGDVVVDMGDFGSGITTSLYQVMYVNVTQATDHLGQVGDYPDPLWPIDSGGVVPIVENENTSCWIRVQVASTTPAGDYDTDFTIDGVAIPVELHVFDFVLPDEIHVQSQLNFSWNTVLQKYSVAFGPDYWSFLDAWKQFFIDHRMTPQSPLWPGGLTTGGGAPLIQYDCGLQQLSDGDGIFGFEEPAARYLSGTGLLDGTFIDPFNDGVGFPNYMMAKFQNNSASADQRPSNFCGQVRSASDWYTGDNPNSAYNQQWFAYITAMRGYLDSQGLLEKSYFYVANEPNSQADYDAVSWYTRELKNAAPDLSLMVSEQANPEIFGHAFYAASGQIDIWLSFLNLYDDAIALDRDANHGEKSWIYFLASTTAPYFNPLTLDRPGADAKLLGWFLWRFRLGGFQHYATTNWNPNPWIDPSGLGQNGIGFLFYPPAEDNLPIPFGSNGNRPVPSIRFELMRDGLEDYEYLRILNGNADPQALVANVSDEQADKVIGGKTSYIRDSEFLYNLRRFIGEKLAGERSNIPLFYPASSHPRAEGPPGDYYINFQDPQGGPTAEPLLVAGHEYTKVGFAAYDAGDGYGWFSAPNTNWMTSYLASGPNELQRSILYSDFGIPATFEFDLPAGVYDVTVSVGWEGRTYSHQDISIEGVPFVTDEGADPGYLARTQRVDILDSKLTMEMGLQGEFTMLNYLDIVGVSAPVSVDPIPAGLPRNFVLGDASPNPFNPSTRIEFELPTKNWVAIAIYDIRGRMVRQLVSSEYDAGRHAAVWDGRDDASRDVATGVYFYRLTSGDFSDSKRVVLLK